MGFALCMFMLCFCMSAGAEFKPIFNGKNLHGWSSPNMSYWSVEDGAITAQSSEQNPGKKNQFLTWTLGELDDFELKLKFKITGHTSANAGIQIRSEIAEDGHAVGYQADIDAAGNWVGALYDEHTGRRMLAKAGQITRISPDGKRDSKPLENGDILKTYDPTQWNDYHIIAKGPRIELRINGKTSAIVYDNETKHQDLLGKLALQLHSGPPMKVQYKDIMLKRLPLTDNRKKIVMVAGRPSHGPGDHEFNAGIKLLKKCLRENMPNVIAVSYHSGMPKDPTAYDNADSIILYMDGGGRHPILKELDQYTKLMNKGVGLMCMHYAVEVPKGDAGDNFRKWIGGYYETHWSINPHWVAKAELNTKHPVTSGVKPFALKDEWYYNMRFRKDMENIKPILNGTPDDEARSGSTSWPRGPKKHIVEASGRSEVLMWSIQRKDGGRGIGFTGGHVHNNWGNDDYRKLVLNGIIWTAGLDVPKKGVQSTISPEFLKKNLDPKGKRK